MKIFVQCTGRGNTCWGNADIELFGDGFWSKQPSQTPIKGGRTVFGDLEAVRVLDQWEFTTGWGHASNNPVFLSTWKGWCGSSVLVAFSCGTKRPPLSTAAALNTAANTLAFVTNIFGPLWKSIFLMTQWPCLILWAFLGRACACRCRGPPFPLGGGTDPALHCHVTVSRDHKMDGRGRSAFTLTKRTRYLLHWSHQVVSWGGSSCHPTYIPVKFYHWPAFQTSNVGMAFGLAVKVWAKLSADPKRAN